MPLLAGGAGPLLAFPINYAPPRPESTAETRKPAELAAAKGQVSSALNRDQLHVHAGRPHQVQQVTGVGGEDVVPVLG